MYRLQSPGHHCLKGDCFLTKLPKKKKNRAVVCFPPNGCHGHFSGHFRILKIERNGLETCQVDINRQRRKRNG